LPYTFCHPRSHGQKTITSSLSSYLKVLWQWGGESKKEEDEDKKLGEHGVEAF
jgi:hypothetical protein